VWTLTATDYFDTPYIKRVVAWLRTLGVDPHDARRVRAWRHGYLYEIHVDVYRRDHEGRLIVDAWDRPLTHPRVVWLDHPTWPEREDTR
jgi:hypothetical protein